MTRPDVMNALSRVVDAPPTLPQPMIDLGHTILNFATANSESLMSFGAAALCLLIAALLAHDGPSRPSNPLRSTTRRWSPRS